MRGGRGVWFLFCHSVLDLTLQETGTALLDFVRSCICFTVEQNLAPKPFWSPFTCVNNCCAGIHIFGGVPNVCMLFHFLFACLGRGALQLFCGDFFGTLRGKYNMYYVPAFRLFLYGSLKMRKQSCALSDTN